MSEEQPIEIREVWGHNLEAEFLKIREIIHKFPLVAMDTEFPGVVCRPVGNFADSDRSEFLYATLKANVDMMKLIQLGLTLFDEVGNHPGCVWQFNFREFHPASDVHASDSIQLLSTSGIDFNQNAVWGVEATRFGELLMSSGIVLNDEIRWITFHSTYDFGYLVKLLTGKNLPDTLDQFLEHLKMYFPVIYDIKHLMMSCNGLHGGLNKVAEILGIKRVGVSHQAGSDSLLTLSTFLKMREFYSDVIEKNPGVLYGFRPYGGEYPLRKNYNKKE